MEKESLDRFGEFIVTNLRDKAIEHYDMLEKGLLKAPGFQKLQKELGKFTPQQRDVVRRCVINTVDDGIYNFLYAIQELVDSENDIQIVVRGKIIAEISDGLHGESYAEDGWNCKFSNYGDVPEEA